jgi:hypothetical protein
LRLKSGKRDLMSRYLIARMAGPPGITRKAGPGNTSITTPRDRPAFQWMMHSYDPGPICRVPGKAGQFALQTLPVLTPGRVKWNGAVTRRCNFSRKLSQEPEWIRQPRQIAHLSFATGFATARVLLLIIRTGLTARFRNGLKVILIFMPTE